MPNHWQHFLTCVGLHFVLPLLPFAFEYAIAGHVTTTTMTIGAAIYVLALGTSSRNMILFFFAFAFAMLYVALDALIVAGAPLAIAHGGQIILGTAAVVVVLHFGERYNRHVMERTPYWKFAHGAEPPGSET